MGNCRDTCSRIESVLKRFVPLLLLVFFTFFGAFLFHLIEEPAELQRRVQRHQDLRHYRELAANRIHTTYEKQPSTDLIKKNQTLEILENLLQKELFRIEVAKGEPAWSFWGALFYSITLYTTVGYGHVVPQTIRGKLVTCLYSLVGIPIFILALFQLGWMIFFLLRKLIAGFRCMGSCCITKWRRVPTSSVPEIQDEIDVLRFPIFSILIVSVAWFFGSAGLLLIWEHQWGYDDALYFLFITYSTIGLGDYVPQNSDLHFLTGIFTLIFLSLLVAIYVAIQKKFEIIARCIRRSIDAQYQAVLVDDGEFGIELSNERSDISFLMHRILHQMPSGTALIYRFLPDHQKAELYEYCAKRATMRSVSVQTEATILFADKYRMGAIGEERRRSHDDINSLVLMCGYNM